MQSNLYSLYLMGMEIARLKFDKETIYHSKKNLDNGRFSDYSELKDVSQYLIPLAKVKKLINTTANIVDLEHHLTNKNNKYQFYKTYSEYIDNTHYTSRVLAERNVHMPLDIILLGDRIIGFRHATRGGAHILIKKGHEALSPQKAWQVDQLSKACHNISNKGVSMIKTRDNIGLATEVWCPMGDIVERPTILIRTPYGRVKPRKYLTFVERGYNVVIQDVRGREDSEGEFRSHMHEIDDGDYTLNWIANQAWSNGDIGMIGASYQGYVQWAAAASGNPHLKAIVSIVTSGSPFGDIPRQGGTLMSGTLAWSFAMRSNVANFDEAERDDWNEIMDIRPLNTITSKVFGEKIGFWDEWLEHPDNDGFWKIQDWSSFGENIDVPALMVSGWYDDDGRGTSEAWYMNKQNNRKNQRMILGPWLHGLNTAREINGIDYGINSIHYDLDSLYLKWFDKHLMKKSIEFDIKDRVNYFMVSENSWYKNEEWPPTNTTLTNLYIGSVSDAKTSFGDGTLSYDTSMPTSFDTYDFDPSDPAPFLIDISQNEMNVPENYIDVEKRKDVLVYTSESLKNDLSIAGDISAIIYASSSALDTDWVVRLTDVDEKGNSIRLSDGVLRARYRESYETPKLLEPGKVERYTIHMSKIANTFKAGHKIRVQITSGMKNFTFPNHNTGNDPASDTEFIVATQKIYHSDKYPSHIVLPVLKK